MNGEHLDIYLRAHTEKVVEKPRTRRKMEKKQLARWPERVLIWDTETRTDIHQKLMFGIFRICKLMGDHYVCEREGIIYSGESDDAALNSAAVLEKSELNAI